MNYKPVSIIQHPYLGQYVNSFVMENGSSSVFIDSGLNVNAGLFTPYLNKKQMAVFATHGHWDHMGLHAYLQEKGAKLYAHPGDQHYLEDLKWHWKVLFAQYADDFDLPAARWTTFESGSGSPVAADIAIADGDIYRFDDLVFEVIHTPGHSDGSVCLLEQKNNVLFTGDSLMGKGFFKGVPQYTDPDAYIKSMEKLKKLSPDMVYTCHDEPLEGKFLAEKAQEGIDTVERIGNLVEIYIKEKSTTADFSLRNMVAFVCEKQNKAAGGGACVSVMAHVRRLKEIYPVVDTFIQSHEEE